MGNWDMWYLPINIRCGAIRLFRRTGTTVDRRIDAPHGGTLMNTLQTHQVLILGPMAFILQPKTVVHRRQNGISLIVIGLRVFTNKLGNTGCQAIAAIVIGRRMGYRSPTII